MPNFPDGLRHILAVAPIFQLYNDIGCDRGHWIILSSAFMRIYVPICISTRPDSQHIRKNPFGKRTHIKRPGRWAFRGNHAAYSAYTLPASESQVFIPTLLA